VITLFVRGLPGATTEESLTELFSTYGTVRSLKLTRDLFTGECKGFAVIGMEGHEARAAIAGLDGKSLEGSINPLRVGPDAGAAKRKGRGRR
jgi:RNA recognition motif-containing protein